MISINDFPIFSLEEAVKFESTSQVKFSDQGLLFDFLFFPKKNKKLLIFFPSALPKDKRFVPQFHRWSWCMNFPEYDCLCVSDPTLHLDSSILGGWMQGTRNSWALEIFCDQLNFICKQKGYETIIFTGSSLGGFCALQASFLFKNKNVKTLFYAENPQINLYDYQYKSHMDRLAKVSFGEKSIVNLIQFDYRLNLVKTAIKFGLNLNGLVVVKQSDEHHFNVHSAYLLKSFPDMPIEVISSDCDSTGHTPLTFCQMSARLQIIQERY